MTRILIAVLLIIVLLFGLSSISQSYASAKQAQAAIEASRTAQIASTGNLVMIITMALVIFAALAAVVLVAWLRLRTQPGLKRKWVSTSNADWEHIQQPDPNAILPTLLTMMMYQMMQNQHHQQSEADLSWLMNDPVNDIPSLPDIPWDM
jgi:hypothetical protein